MSGQSEGTDLTGRLEALFQRRTFGIKPGLEVEQALLEAMGHPERAYASIHVAGTNGKGSICAMIAAVLEKAGFPTGLYTSPHLVRFHERMRVNGVSVTDAELLALWEKGEEAERRAFPSGERTATFFEFTTALAFEFFRRRGVRVAVIEVGMGGRLDATNVLEPLVSVIAPVGLDHQAYLGPDLSSIAREKCGIIKAGRPVIYAQTDPEAEAVILRSAAERGSRAVNAAEWARVTRQRQTLDGQRIRIETANADYGLMRLPLLGRHQLLNVAAAVTALEVAFGELGLPLSTNTVQAGLESVRWPGRLQILGRDPLLLLDGAHNPPAAAVLANALREIVGRRPVGLVCGMCEDKDQQGFFSVLASRLRRVWTVPLRTPRSSDPEALARLARQRGLEAEAEATLTEAREKAVRWAREEGGAVCLAGSLFLVGEVLEQEGYRP